MGIIVNSKNVDTVARDITVDSQLYGDEIATVRAELGSLLNSAEEFGCKMEGVVHDMWGNTVSVVAIPDHFRDSWSF